MPHDLPQETFWDNASFPQQTLGVDLLEGNIFKPLDLIVCSLQAGMAGSTTKAHADEQQIDTSSPKYIQGLNGESIGFSYSDWVSGSDYSPGPPRLDKPFPNSNTQHTTGPRRPSAEAIARRRKQNRLSQAAWRARNKELVEELRQEIAEHTEYNHTMQETLQSLLKTTETLKGAIENALALAAPKGEGEKKGNGEGQLLTPESSEDTTGFDLDAPHDP